MLGCWPCLIKVSETSSPQKGKTYSLNSPMNNRMNKGEAEVVVGRGALFIL